LPASGAPVVASTTSFHGHIKRQSLLFCGPALYHGARAERAAQVLPATVRPAIQLLLPMTTFSPRVVTQARSPGPIRRRTGLAAFAFFCLITTSFSVFRPESIGAAETGSISGQVEPGLAVDIVAVDRASGQRFSGNLDAKTGTFTIEKLPLAANYDCIIDYGAARLEGIDLSVPPSDYEEEQPLTEEDIAKLKQTVLSLNQFEDQVEVLAIEGNIEHAAILLNKLRTRPFVNSRPGEVVWRVERWQFERPDETWVKVQDKLFHTLYRERIDRAQFDKKAIAFTPDLGGIRLDAGRPAIDLGDVRVPTPAAGVRFVGRNQVVAGPGAPRAGQATERE
jgi:hypothetical protein